MWCMTCFSTPHASNCVKAPKSIAFDCDKCGSPVYLEELEDEDCFETPDGRIICGECVYKMSTVQALVYLGCITKTSPAV